MVCLIVLNVAYFGWGLYQMPSIAVSSQAGGKDDLPPLKGKQLELISESRVSADGSKPPPSLVSVRPDMCYSLGPLAGREEGDLIVGGLAEQGVRSKLQVIELSREVQYWVLLPNYETRRDALDALRQLQSKKIDSYLIESGELKNGISLGLFSKESSATGILDKIKAVGFAAEVRQKVRIKNEFWVRILPGQTLENLQKTLLTLKRPASNAKISKASCEMFALSK